MSKRKLPKNLYVTTLGKQSPFLYAHFNDRTINKRITTKTADRNKAEAFAIKWHKEYIVPLLEETNNSEVKVIDFVMEKCTFLGKSKWNSEEYGFLDLPMCSTRKPGIYLILHGKKILKVGKADGAHGLYGRLYSYRSSNRHRVHGKYPDQFTVMLNNKMNLPELSGKALSFYYYEIPKKRTILEGFEIESCVARSFEKQLSKQCRLQNHPMTLSGSD